MNEQKRPGVWAPVVLMVVYWGHNLAGRWLEIVSMQWFLSALGVLAIVLLGFLGWWLFNRRIGRGEKWGAVAAFVVGLVVVAVGGKNNMGLMPMLMFALPWVLSAWTVMFIVSRGWSGGARRSGVVLAIGLAWGFFLLTRIDGLRGNAQMDVRWRWRPTAEQAYLASLKEKGESLAVSTVATTRPVVLREGDWPGFRGPGRDGVVRGVNINTDWKSAPPKLVWKTAVGPAWSSMAVVDGLVYTQEQRGEMEAVVCRDAANGREVWVHEDGARFEEGVSGVGPRATPTFADGRIYAQGAKGVLNCLDARRGWMIWKRDVKADSGAAVPIWGFSASPLVTNGVVVVFPGGEGGKSLVAYRVENGEIAWTAAGGKHAYGSPQVEKVGGEEQVLLFSDFGLQGFSPESGRQLWRHEIPPAAGLPPSLVAVAFGKDAFLISWGNGLGTALVEVTHSGDGWSTARKWTSRQLKPSFNDLVVHEGFVYGFDGSTLCCLNAANGQRMWREGRYGNGQMVLLAEQGLLLIACEEGEIALVKARSDRHEELARVEGIKGKVWNHPAVAGNRMYVRSDEEMGCFELSGR